MKPEMGRVRSEPRSRPRIRLFKSDLLERLTVISPRAFVLIWLGVFCVALSMSWRTASIQASIGLLALGLLIWTLFEYAMHRFLFHWKTRFRIFQWVVFITHGNHHVDATDPHRNMMPPIVSVPVSASIWALCLLALGPKGTILYVGFTIGYVLYDGVHYACHQFPMRRGVLRQLKRHHTRHHYAKSDGNYAITMILWDRLFGTRIPDKGG